MTGYRYPNESLILGLTLFLVFLVLAITATVTLFTGLIFVFLTVLMAYSASKVQHRALLRRAYPVNVQSSPRLVSLVQQCLARLRLSPVEVFVAPSRALNAYTFGLDSPKIIVLYSALLEVMDEDELRFIIGHELGHVALGHTWLNSLVGGVAGIPAYPLVSSILRLAFLSWNRACELSADRAGLLACGRPDKALSALLKLVAGPSAASAAGLQAVLQRMDEEEATLASGLGEALATHPMIIRRIKELRRYAASDQYRRFQTAMNQGKAR